jgi:hypothetical protein
MRIQIYLSREELQALRRSAARSRRSVSDFAREAIRKVVLGVRATGPVAIWRGQPRRTSMEHDTIHDQLD